MNNLVLCTACSTPKSSAEACCPTCCTAKRAARTSLPQVLGVLGLGLTVSACGDQDIQPEYGVAIDDTAYEDTDNDGFSPLEGDCDDTDAAINPEATETPGDGVDSNCNGEDDT